MSWILLERINVQATYSRRADDLYPLTRLLERLGGRQRRAEVKFMSARSSWRRFSLKEGGGGGNRTRSLPNRINGLERDVDQSLTKGSCTSRAPYFRFR